MLNWLKNNLKTILVITILLLIGAGVGIWLGFEREVVVPTYKIDFESKINDTNFKIINRDTNFETTFKTPHQMKLRSGLYYVFAQNQKKYTRLPQQVVAIQDEKIELKFEYSPEYNNEILSADRSDIISQIQQKYPKTITENDFVVSPGAFFHHGKYFATRIGRVDSGEMVGTNYYIIFQKADSDWRQITHPELIISSVDYPDIPKDIVQTVNFWGTR